MLADRTTLADDLSMLPAVLLALLAIAVMLWPRRVAGIVGVLVAALALLLT